MPQEGRQAAQRRRAGGNMAVGLRHHKTLEIITIVTKPWKQIRKKIQERLQMTTITPKPAKAGRPAETAPHL
eukprot:6855678-Prymnesium_polylepis.1